MKRVFSAILVCAVLLSCCVSAFAVTESVERAANVLSTYNASASAGANSGEVKISFNASANQRATSIGASSIVIHKSDGSYVTIIKGSTGNGLMALNASRKSGSYTYKGTPGVSYYAVVTITASAGGETDNKTVTMNRAQAK